MNMMLLNYTREGFWRFPASARQEDRMFIFCNGGSMPKSAIVDWGFGGSETLRLINKNGVWLENVEYVLIFWGYVEVLEVDNLRLLAWGRAVKIPKFIEISPPWQSVHPTPCCGWPSWLPWKMRTTGRKRCNFCASSRLGGGWWFVESACGEFSSRAVSLSEQQKLFTSEFGLGNLWNRFSLLENAPLLLSFDSPCFPLERWQPGADVALHLGCIRLLLRVGQLDRALQLYGTLEDSSGWFLVGLKTTKSISKSMAFLGTSGTSGTSTWDLMHYVTSGTWNDLNMWSARCMAAYLR